MFKGHVRMWSCLAVLAAVSFLSGCGSKSGEDSVTGKVTLNGQAVGGEVVFLCSDGKDYRSPIGTEGRYSIIGAPKGEAKITIRSMVPPGGGTAPPTGAAKAPEMPGNAQAAGVPAPAKFSKTETSGLTYTIKGGKEEHNITLTP